MTSHIATRRRFFSGAFLIGSLIAFGSATQAQVNPDVLPITGTWTRGGNDTVAWVDLATWTLVTTVEGTVPVAGPEPLPWIPVAGDWDGDGVDSVLMFSPRDWRLLPAERGPVEGQVGDPIPWRPVAGDWDGDRIDTVMVVNACDGSLHKLEDGPTAVGFCDPDDWWFSVAGDWDGDGLETPALYQPKGTSALWATVSGDWNGDGIETLATLHLPTNKIIEPEAEIRATSSTAVSSQESGSLSNLFAEGTGGGSGCFTTIKNGQSVPVVTSWVHGVPVYQCKNTWEQWTCCLNSSLLGSYCIVQSKSSITPTCMF